jgi:DNA polymerase III subunit delta
MHATAFLKTPPATVGAVAVLFGEESYLKRLAFERLCRIVLGEDDDDERLGLTRFAGDQVDLKTVCDELRTVSMWGTNRLVAVDDADRFVSQNREGLEKYLQKPARNSLLVLDVKAWPKTTRLAKAVPKVGLDLECAPLSGNDLVRWIADTAKNAHGKSLSRDAAGLIRELAGDDLGLLEQELAKLSAYVGERKSIEIADVQALVGGWATETTWSIAAAIRRGEAGEALDLLGQLLAAGESPHKIFGGLTFVFRRLAQAVERASQGTPLDRALAEAGVFPRELGESAAYLRRLGRAEAQRLSERLLGTDRALKGAVIMPERDALEMLIVQLSGASVLPQRK